MKHRYVVGALFMLLLAGCGVQQQAKEPIKVGVLLPLTGSLSTYGESSLRGIQLALDEFRTSTQPMELLIEDSQGDVKKGLSAANKLVQIDGVNIVIGDLASSVSLGIAPVIEENRVLMIAPGSAVPSLTDAGDYIFRLKLSAAIDSVKMAENAHDQLQFKNVAVIVINNDYGVGIKEQFTKAYEGLGGTVALFENFLPESNDFRGIITKIRASDVDAIVLASHAQETGFFLKQLDEMDVDVPVFTHRGSFGPDTFAIAGEAAEGLLFLEEFDSESSRPETKNFVQQFKKKYEPSPDLFAVMGYDALKLVEKGITHCSDDSSCLKEYLYNAQDYHGASGVIHFDENGDVQKDVVLMEIQDGESVAYVRE